MFASEKTFHLSISTGSNLKRFKCCVHLRLFGNFKILKFGDVTKVAQLCSAIWNFSIYPLFGIFVIKRTSLVVSPNSKNHRIIPLQFNLCMRDKCWAFQNWFVRSCGFFIFLQFPPFSAAADISVRCRKNELLGCRKSRSFGFAELELPIDTTKRNR